MSEAAAHAVPDLTAAQLAAEFPAGRRPRRPMVLRTGFDGPREHPTLAHLAADVAGLLGPDVRPVLIRTVATYPGFDTFPAFSIHAEAIRGLAGLVPGPATYVAAVAVQDTSAEALHDAIVAAQARLRAADPQGRAAA